MNRHYKNQINSNQTRAIAATQSAEQMLMRKIALFATITDASLLLLLLINP